MATILPRRPPHGDVTKIPTPSLQAVGIFINFFFPALALVVVSLRSYSRIKMRQWGSDDYLMCLAMLCSLLMCGPFYMYIKLNYFGWYAVDVPEFDPAPGRWWFYLAQLLYNPILAFVKASILLFLLRLGGQKPGVRYAIYGLFTFNALQAVAIFLVALLQCIPIKANWDPVAAATTKCVDPSFHISISCLTILTDVLVLALPFWVFLGLKMPMASKIAVIGVFLLGISVTIVAIVRLVDMYRLFYVPSATTDPYHSIGITLNAVEVNVAIISASIPALRPLFRSWLPGLFGGSSGQYPNTSGQYGASKSGHLPRSNAYYTEANVAGNGTNKSIPMKGMRGNRLQHAECRSVSPNGSEEEIMTYNGIMKSTDVRVQFDGVHDDHSLSRLSSDLEGTKDPRPTAL